MSTSGGLSRRRVGANGGASSSYDDDDGSKLSPTNSGSGGGGGSRSNTPAPAPPQHAHAGSAFEGGNKIAFDPRDLQQDASEEARTGGKLPRLTIMEEVLLLGIKDKQVTPFFPFFDAFFKKPFQFCRVICLSGTTTFHTSYVAVFLSS
jgi:Golgi phosphoprotein 3